MFVSLFFLTIFSPISLSIENDEDVRSVFEPHHEFLAGLIPSTSSDDPFLKLFGVPGMYQDLKLELAGGRYQCFYQKLLKDAKVYIYFEVLKGSDKNIDVEIIKPDGVALKTYRWITEGELEETIPETGVYSICFDNSLSKFSNKIITFYIHSFFEDEWNKMGLDFEESLASLSKSLDSFQVIDNNVKRMADVRKREGHMIIKDWYLIKENNSFVQNASIFLCICIVLISGFQTFFVKKLFASSLSKPTV